MIPRQPLVTDASIWISLERAGVLLAVLDLPYDFISPDLVAGELRTPMEGLLAEAGLRIESLSGEEVAALVDLTEKYPAPGRKDLSTLVLAKKLSAVLLTGDAKLRAAAAQEGIEVHGVLWLLQQMVDHELLGPLDAAGLVDTLTDRGIYLPKRECGELQNRWRNVAE